MGWADFAIKKLQQGETVKVRPSGNSMVPKIRSKQLCTIEPICEERVDVGDVVLCRVHGSQYLHNVSALVGERYQISNNKGRINGVVALHNIFGRLTNVEE